MVSHVICSFTWKQTLQSRKQGVGTASDSMGDMRWEHHTYRHCLKQDVGKVEDLKAVSGCPSDAR